MRLAWLLLVSWTANSAIPVNTTGTSNQKITYRPFTSTSVAVTRVASLPNPSPRSTGVSDSLRSTGVTDTPTYAGPNVNQTPAAQARAWAVHADTLVALTIVNNSRESVGRPKQRSHPHRRSHHGQLFLHRLVPIRHSRDRKHAPYPDTGRESRGGVWAAEEAGPPGIIGNDSHSFRHHGPIRWFRWS